MKKFYCTICLKLKYVRVMPKDILNPEDPNPLNRIGQCDFHRYDHILPRKNRAK